MKPIKINNLEDLALALKGAKMRDAAAKRNAEPPEYRHFTNAEGDVISKLPEDQQTELKRLKTLPNRKGYIVEDRRPIMSASSNNGKDWTGARCDTPAPLTVCPATRPSPAKRMKPIILNSFEDLALALKLSEVRARRAARNPILIDHNPNGVNWVYNAVVQAEHAATYGLDFGALEDSRAFVKMHDGQGVEAVPDNPEAVVGWVKTFRELRADQKARAERNGLIKKS